MSNITVALAKGENSYQNTQKILNLLEGELIPKIKKAKRLIIKPNFVSTTNKFAATNVEAVGAILDFLKRIYNGKIILAENAALGNTSQGFTNFGFFKLAKNYNVKFMDLSRDQFLPFKISDISGRKIEIGISKTILDSDFRISVTPAKTHDEVIVTLSLKNLIMGSLDRRPLVHQGPRQTNLNLANLARVISPHLAIIDGTVGMEGNGPSEGSPIKSNFAVGSTSGLAADMVATKVMGFKPEDIGYLYFLGIPKNLKIVGETIDRCQKKFAAHRRFSRQLQWKKRPSLIEKFFIPILTNLYLKTQQLPFYKQPWFAKIKEPLKKLMGY
jgi:uncharacterized protein (DUF362 family)